MKNALTSKLTSTTETVNTNSRNTMNVSVGSGTYGIPVPGTVWLFTMFSTNMSV